MSSVRCSSTVTCIPQGKLSGQGRAGWGSLSLISGHQPQLAWEYLVQHIKAFHSMPNEERWISARTLLCSLLQLFGLQRAAATSQIASLADTWEAASAKQAHQVCAGDVADEVHIAEGLDNGVTREVGGREQCCQAACSGQAYKSNTSLSLAQRSWNLVCGVRPLLLIVLLTYCLRWVCCCCAACGSISALCPQSNKAPALLDAVQ